MALELRDCTFYGPALPEPFVKFQLERELNKRNLLARTTGPEGRALEERWEVFRRKLRQLGEQGGDRRVANHVLEPLIERLGYASLERQAAVITREGAEDGGWLFSTPDGKKLRGWAVSLGTDLDAPNRHGRAYRFSPSRVAQRVLLASGERMGLLTDGEELRILLCDPARPDSHIGIRLDRAGGWRAARGLPDSYRLLLALASPAGVAALPDLTDAARLAQSSVTKKLRLQARRAIEGFLQELLDHPSNQTILAQQADRQQLAWRLWSEGLITVYRLLFVFKLEASADPARAFSFAATSLWRNTYSPNTALADLVRRVLDEGKESGGFLEAGLRTLWRLFAEGMSSSELEIKPLGGMLFGRGATPLLDQLRWGEQAVARLLDALLWTPGEGGAARERVHYGALDVEDLGRVYESLLELEPGISGEAMCRLRRAKLEVVVPVAQGEPYRGNQGAAEAPEAPDDDEAEGSDEAAENTGRGGRAPAGSKTKVEFIEEIPADRFFLRVGLGRKASGSYYTPHPFVRFLVQETLGVLLAECSPRENPQPGLILRLKVLDSAMGSGHFLVEACRFLGEGLYEACRLCDELAVQAEEQAEKVEGAERELLLSRAADLRRRVEDLPDPNNELLAYLPSRAAEGEESGLSQKKAEAMCRRLVAVHCLYGVDKNPLAVELAKLSLWLESYAEGLPLTFLDHRLICGDSLTGPFFEHLLTYPKSGGRLDDLFAQGLTQRLQDTLAAALVHVRDLEASVGKDLADLHQKESAKAKLDAALAPLKTLATAWSGAKMVGDESADSDYSLLAKSLVSTTGKELSSEISNAASRLLTTGEGSLCYQLEFPEVFFGKGSREAGFDAVIGNPPWDTVRPLTKEFFASFDLRILDAPTKRERDLVQARLERNQEVVNFYQLYQLQVKYAKNVLDGTYRHQRAVVEGKTTGGDADLAKYFSERSLALANKNGSIGLVLPAAIHNASGATGIRQLFLNTTRWEILYSFSNALSLFEVETKVKFDIIVLRLGTSTSQVKCQFNQKSISALYSSHENLVYTVDFVRETGGGYLAFLEPSSRESAQVAQRIYAAKNAVFQEWCMHRDIRIGSECHATSDSWRFMASPSDGRDYRDQEALDSLLQDNSLIVANEDSLHQYDDHWKSSPRYHVSLQKLQDKPAWIKASRYFRLMYRRIANIIDLRSMKAAIVPPGWVSASPYVLQAPQACSYAQQLITLALLNSYPFDWCLRLRLTATLSRYIVNSLPVPSLEPDQSLFVAHSALRLTCNHSAYRKLWEDQLETSWKESSDIYQWPVAKSLELRWKIKACIDAIIASSYRLDRYQYKHILTCFSHRGNPQAPSLCIEAFDELLDLGAKDFIRKYDPYWDVPLKDALPQPAVDFRLDGQVVEPESHLGPLFNGLNSNGEELIRLSEKPGKNISISSSSLDVSTSPMPSNGAFATIADLLRTQGVITSRDAQQATGLDAAGVRPHLQQLVQQGLAVTEGQRRGMLYRRVDG